MGLPLETQEFYDFSGGMNDRDSDTALNDTEWSFLRNAEFNRDGGISTRLGSERVNTTPINGGTPFLLDFYYSFDDGTNNRLIVNGGSLELFNNGSPIVIQTGFDPTHYWSAAQLANRVILGNGIDGNFKWDGTHLYSLGIVAPSAIGFTATLAGGGTLPDGSYTYAYTYRNSITLDESNPEETAGSPVFVTATAGGGNNTIVLSGIIASTDPQVDEMVFYRSTVGTTGPLFQISVRANNNSNFTDTGLPDGDLELAEDNDIAPLSAIFASFLGRLYTTDGKDFLYYSKPFQPGMTPVENVFRVGRDGQKITNLLAIGNQSLLTGKERSIYILPGDPGDGVSVPQIFTTQHGVLNNRSTSVFEDSVFFVDQSLRPYSMNPTELANSERRVYYLGRRLGNTFNGINAGGKDNIKVETITLLERKQWLMSIPLQTISTDAIAVLDFTVTPSEGSREAGAWSVWTGLPAGTLKVWPDANGIPTLWRGDYRGFMWSQYINEGDGAAINGTATSGTTTTLTDTTQTFTVNSLMGIDVLFVKGTGLGQRANIISNTTTTLTFSAVPIAPDNTTQYAIGGIDFQAYTNWKKVVGGNDIIKRLWFLWFNFSNVGNYTTDVKLQFDFNTSLNASIPFTIQATPNTLWGFFLWGSGIWGGVTSIEQKFQLDQYFHHMRIAFFNSFAGQPVILNGLSVTAQEKGLFTQ